jgi:HD-GYP domain-containing protein (c-di-GMP phosphodiesterase class II)
MNDLRAELMQLNEAIDMICTVLDMQHDPQLVEQLEKLLEELKVLVERYH